MLERLHIKNFAIIDEITLEFRDGFITMTGETGAGKSILLGALDLVLGGRAQSSNLNSERGSTIVEATFDRKVSLPPDILDDDGEDQIILRRVISASGKSRAFINDLPATLQDMSKLREYLIDIHKQMDTSWLLSKPRQLEILDTLADQWDDRKAYQQDYLKWNTQKKDLTELLSQIEQNRRDYDYYSFQLKELDEADLDGVDLEALESERLRLSQIEDIKESLSTAAYALSEGDTPLIDQLRSLRSTIENVPVPQDQRDAWSAVLTGCTEELLDLESQITDEIDRSEPDPERLQLMAERLDAIYRLQQKHGTVDLSSLVSMRDDIRSKLHSVDQADDQRATLEADIAKLQVTLLKRGKKLSAGRERAAKALSREVETLLSDLSMPFAQLVILLEATSAPQADGLDELQFLFSANKGQQPQPLSKVASGGERSRVALCIKSTLAGKMDMPTMILDEIDAGVSGDVAMKMGRLLARLSDNHQLICITHSPQIASLGDQHLFIYKDNDGAQTSSHIRELEAKDRVYEIAKMLSTDPPSDSAVANARELLDA